MENDFKEWIKLNAHLTENIGELVIVLDSSFDILHANQKAVSEFLIDDFSFTLEQIFQDDTVRNLTDEISQALYTNQKKTIKDFLINLSTNENLVLDLTISPAEYNNDKIVFLIFNSREVNKSLNLIDRIQINLEKAFTNEKIEEIKSLLKIIEELIPFTIIGQKKLKIIIDDYSFPIWIKDLQFRFISINKFYSEQLGIDSGFASGKKHESFLPSYLTPVYKTIDEYVLASSNPILLETSGKKNRGDQSNKVIVQIPLLDNRHKIYAILGLIYDKEERENNYKDQSQLVPDFINLLPKPALLVNIDGKIEQINQEFCKFLGKEFGDVYQKNFIDFFPYFFSENIKSFIKSDLLNDNLYVDKEFNPVDYSNSVANVFLIKVGSQDKNKKNLLIIIDSTQNLNSFDIELQNILKNRGKMFDVLIQNNPEPIFIYDKENLKFLEVNEAAIKLYGYNREEFLQMDLTDLYAPEDIQTLLSSFDDESTQGRFSRPFRHKRKDGSTVIVEISKTSFKFNDRETHFNIVKDVTAEVEQEKQNQMFRIIFNSTESLVLTTDAEGFITFINHPVIEFFGYTSDELIKSSFASLVTDEDRALVNTSVFQPELKTEISLDSKIKTADGNYLDAEITAYPILDFNQEVSAFTIIIKPKKQIEKTEESKKVINEAQKDILVETPSVASNIVKVPDTNFISGVFHEILTPMNVIIGFAQELIGGIEKPSEEQIEAAEIINQNRIKMMNTMNALAEYSDIVQNKSVLNIEEIPITDIIDSLDKNSNQIMELNEIQFSYGKISSSLKFKTDRQKIETLISYLIKIISRLSKDKKVYFSAYAIDPDSFFIGLSDKYGTTSDYVAETFDKVFNENKNPRDFGLPTLTTYVAKAILSLLRGKFFKSIAGSTKNEAGFLFPVELTAQTDNLFKESDFEPEVQQQPVPEKTGGEEEEFPEKFIESEILEEKLTEESGESNSFGDKETDEDKQLKYSEESGKQELPIEEETASLAEKKELESEIYESSKAEPQTVSEEEGKKSPVEEPSVQAAEVEQNEEKEFIPPKPQLNLSDLSCLYIEDQVDSQILFKVQMKGLREIKFAVSFEDAQPMLLNNKFDFIIMDINLQGEYNGLDALKIIKTMPALSDIPIIAVTAYVLPGDKEKFIAAGFDDFISKPIFREKMMESLEKIFLPH